MADQCPKCGYAMDPFDETCKRCANLKALPQQPAQAPPTVGAAVADSRGKAEERLRRETATKASRGAWGAAIFLSLFGGFIFTVGGADDSGHLPPGHLINYIVLLGSVVAFEQCAGKARSAGISVSLQRWVFWGLLVGIVAGLLTLNAVIMSRPLPAKSAERTQAAPTGGGAQYQTGRDAYRGASPLPAPVPEQAPTYYRPRPNPMTTGRRPTQWDKPNPELLREKQQTDQIQRNLAANITPMYPPRTQPPNWIPRGQTTGHWVGSGSSTGEDSWVWVDGNGRQVGPTYFSRPAQ